MMLYGIMSSNITRSPSVVDVNVDILEMTYSFAIFVASGFVSLT